MEMHAFTEWAARLVGTVNDHAAALDGRAAFVLGLLTWFTVEQALRRMAAALRIAIIVTALGASGLGVATFMGAFEPTGTQHSAR